MADMLTSACLSSVPYGGGILWTLGCRVFEAHHPLGVVDLEDSAPPDTLHASEDRSSLSDSAGQAKPRRRCQS
jgi:hypothetical protein